ncbi:MAG: twin-arginine translocation signal domain-containing protein [Chloroflexi bacterium]|nr:MAG: twin-arginine translocation signal domain-containing protein [Chloroflexota bacterium]TME19758.1 MAG: twin-arginine translocation signal domain-containing protein [Chloroflexota bacterium]
MKQMDRRSFLKLAGAGSAAAAAAAAIPIIASTTIRETGVLRFSASLGLPAPPLPSYATQVVEGSVDLSRGTGLVTSRVLAGHPGATSDIGLPGLARVIRITAATPDGARLRLRGLIEDRSQLRPGESPRVEIIVDRARGLLQAPFLGRAVELKLA